MNNNGIEQERRKNTHIRIHPAKKNIFFSSFKMFHFQYAFDYAFFFICFRFIRFLLLRLLRLFCSFLSWRFLHISRLWRQWLNLTWRARCAALSSSCRFLPIYWVCMFFFLCTFAHHFRLIMGWMKTWRTESDSRNNKKIYSLHRSYCRLKAKEKCARFGANTNYANFSIAEEKSVRFW